MSNGPPTSARAADGEHRHLGELLVAAPTSETALKALYDLTAPRLAGALSVVANQDLVEQVLVATYVRVRHEALPQQLTDEAALTWLTRTALVELGASRRLTR